MASVRFENVSISYGAKQVVKDFSLSVNDGEIMGIIGPSMTSWFSATKNASMSRPNAAASALCFRIMRCGRICPSGTTSATR